MNHLYYICYKCKKLHNLQNLKISWFNDGHNGDRICMNCYNDKLSFFKYFCSFFYDSF
jgi:hypothetical protein